MTDYARLLGANTASTSAAAATMMNTAGAAPANAKAINEAMVSMQTSIKADIAADLARMGVSTPTMGGSPVGMSAANGAAPATSSLPSVPVQNWGQSGGTLRLYNR